MRLHLPRLLTSAALVLGCVHDTAAGTPDGLFEQQYVLRVFETDDGLTHNAVFSVVQRPDGYLWIATNGGLVRFDGVQFAPTALPAFSGQKSSGFRALIAENQKNLLLANASAVIRLVDGDHLVLHPVTADIRRGQNIRCLLREGDDVFWIVFSNREAWRWAHGQLERFPPPAKILPSAAPPTLAKDAQGEVFLARGAGIERYQAGRLVPLPAVAAATPALIGPARHGGIWVATATQLARLDQNGLTVVTDRPPWTAPAELTAILEDSQGALWISVTGQGIKRWTPQGSLSLSPSHPLVNSLFEDDEDNLWAATLGGGLDCFRPARCALLAPSADWITDGGASVCEDNAGNVWYVNRHGIRKIHGTSIETLQPENGWPRGAVPACCDAAGNVWLAVGPRICVARAGNDQPPLWLNTKSSSNIRVFYASRTGEVWVGREAGPLECYRNFVRRTVGPEAGYPGGRALAISEDARGHLWVGTGEGGLFEWKDDHFARYGARDGMPEKEIRAIYGDAAGDLWIGTFDGLVVRHQNRFYQLTVAQGLVGHTISQLLEDDAGTLWFCTPRGLSRVEKSDLLECVAGHRSMITPIIYGKPDGISGLSAIGSYQPTAWKTRAGRLWFTTRKGLVTIDPDEPVVKRRLPRVYLERFLVDSRALEPGSARFPSSAKRIEFKFTAPTFFAPEDVRFRYRLEGLDSEWSEPTTQRFAIYPELRPGRYQFKVIACNSDLVWNTTGATVAFEVIPMWWETWWARLGGLLAAGLALALAVRYWSHRRLKARLQLLQQQQRVEAERKRIARDLHDGLGANLTQAGLTAEALAEDCGDYAEMKSLAANLAEQIRGIARDLDTTVWAVSPKNDSLRSLCAYLCQFSLEYFRHSPVRCHVHAAEDIPALPLSPETRHHLFMIAQELMNNVLKHARASQVDLTIAMDRNYFLLRLADNGGGFSPATAEASGRSGLRNIRLRAAEIGGTLDLQSSAQGTVAQVRVPLPVEGRTLRAHHPAAL